MWAKLTEVYEHLKTYYFSQVGTEFGQAERYPDAAQKYLRDDTFANRGN